jgi:hypothetical protein
VRLLQHHSLTRPKLTFLLHLFGCAAGTLCRSFAAALWARQRYRGCSIRQCWTKCITGRTRLGKTFVLVPLKK